MAKTSLGPRASVAAPAAASAADGVSSPFVPALAVATLVLAMSLLSVSLEFAYRYVRLGSFRLEPSTFVEDPDLLYRLNPSNPGFPSSFRGKAPGTSKDAEHLIICMGGSATFGQGISAQHAWPAALEGFLQSQGIRAEVINAGVPGYGMRQLLLRYRRDIAPLQPDFVIVYSGFNRCGRLVDPLGWSPILVPRSGFDWFRRAAHAAGSESALFRHAFQRLVELQNGWHWHEWVGDAHHNTYVDDLRTLAREIDSRGQRAVLVVYPSLFYEGMSAEAIALYQPIMWEHRSYRPEMLDELRRKHAAIRTVAAETGALLVDVQEAFAPFRAEDRMAFFFDEMHPTAFGNQKVAEIVGEALAKALSSPEVACTSPATVTGILKTDARAFPARRPEGTADGTRGDHAPPTA